MTNGIRMAMVAQAVPVANAMNAEVRNTSIGINSMGIVSLRTCARYSAVPRSFVICPNDQAIVRMTTAISIDFIPVSQASKDSLRLSILWDTDKNIATMHPANEPQRRVSNGSEAPKMSISVACEILSVDIDARPVV